MESDYVKLVNKKYVFETLENEGKIFDELELKKKVVVGEVVKGESKVVEGDIKSEESGSESSRRWKREIKDIITKEDVKEKKMKKLMILEEELELLIEKKEKSKKKKIMKKREIYIINSLILLMKQKYFCFFKVMKEMFYLSKNI